MLLLVWVDTNEAAMNIRVQVFMWTYAFISPGQYLGAGRSGCRVDVWVLSKKMPNSFPKWLPHFIFPPEFQLLCTLIHIWNCPFFKNQFIILFLILAILIGM